MKSIYSVEEKALIVMESFKDEVTRAEIYHGLVFLSISSYTIVTFLCSFMRLLLHWQEIDLVRVNMIAGKELNTIIPLLAPSGSREELTLVNNLLFFLHL